MTHKDDSDKQELLIPEECYRWIASEIKPLYHWHSVLNDIMWCSEYTPTYVAESIQDVLLYGLDKYGEKDSWKYIEDAQQRYAGAYHRHMVQIAEHGIESTDPESGLRHSSHAMCNAMFLLWFEIQGAMIRREEWYDSQ